MKEKAEARVSAFSILYIRGSIDLGSYAMKNEAREFSRR
jgi:hypothetical protein